MAIVLGLDISTACVGLCLLHDEQIILLKGIEFKKCKTMFEKADAMFKHLQDWKTEHGDIDRLCIEEALMCFRPGMSSAKTISQLMRFNGIVSYVAREVYKKDPEYIAASHARKLCGIKMQKTAVAGPQKSQVFKYMSEHDLASIKWPLTKAGKVAPWACDATDAFVIAKAGQLIEHV
jgi:hypothetical protein